MITSNRKLGGEILLVLMAGAIYLIGVVYSQQIMMYFFGVPAELPIDSLRPYQGRLLWGSLLIRSLPLLLILPLLLFRFRTGQLRTSIRAEPFGVVVGAVMLTLGASLVLNRLDWWPFTWRWAADPSGPLMRTWLSERNYLGVVLWGIITIAVVPLVEECVFRFGLLRAIWRKTRSRVVAVILSSTVFGIAHLGQLSTAGPDQQHINKAVWTFMFALVLAFLTINRRGRIGIPLVVHGARNLLEFALLLALLV